MNGLVLSFLKRTGFWEMPVDSCVRGKQDSNTSLVTNSLREAKWIMVIWFLSSVWTIGYCSLYGFQSIDPAHLSMILGMPSWVFWGVAVPWLVTTLASIGFAMGLIREDDLDGSSSDSGAETFEPPDTSVVMRLEQTDPEQAASVRTDREENLTPIEPSGLGDSP
jgi:hypothetical protein